MSLYTSGRSDTYFPDALTFSPKRWLREGGSYQGVTEATASLPFAMGSRSCIGRKMAEAEFTLTLAHVCCNTHNLKLHIWRILQSVTFKPNCSVVRYIGS